MHRTVWRGGGSIELGDRGEVNIIDVMMFCRGELGIVAVGDTFRN